MRRALLFCAAPLALVLAGSMAVANPGMEPDPQQMVERLQQGLGLSADEASEVAEVMLTTHELRKALRQDVGREARALKAALDAGDEAAMLDAMAALEDLKAEGEAIQQETRAQLQALLTVEQQAKMTLHHLHKRHRMERAMHEMRKEGETSPRPMRRR